jgi:hypothetical protein
VRLEAECVPERLDRVSSRIGYASGFRTRDNRTARIIREAEPTHDLIAPTARAGSPLERGQLARQALEALLGTPSGPADRIDRIRGDGGLELKRECEEQRRHVNTQEAGNPLNLPV